MNFHGVTVKFTDGCDHGLVIHEISALQIIQLFDELQMNSFAEMRNPQSLKMLRFVTKVVALALTFKQSEDLWTVKRVAESFANLGEVMKVFLLCVKISPAFLGDEPQAVPPFVGAEKETMKEGSIMRNLYR